MRLDNLQHEAAGDGRVECIAPRSRMPIAVWEASQCVLATTPKVPRISGRVVNVMGGDWGLCMRAIMAR